MSTMSTASTMKAITQDRYGDADVLELRDIPRPTVGKGCVRVRVRTAGVDMGAWHLMTGLPQLARFFGLGLRRPKNPVRGLELAGVVDAIGEGVTRFKVGDEVFGVGDGAFAEYAIAKERYLVFKPSGVSFDDAAASAVSGLTAMQAVDREGRVEAGQRVLVLGAGGGVGSFAVQLAKAAGAHVTGVCSTAKVALVRSLGADAVIDYRTSELHGEYDVIIDTGGQRPLAVLRALLSPTGTLVIVGGEGGSRFLGGLSRTLAASLPSLPFGAGSRQKLRSLISLTTVGDLERVAELLARGSMRAAIERRYPLAEVPDAMRRLAAGEAQGKLVIAVSDA